MSDRVRSRRLRQGMLVAASTFDMGSNVLGFVCCALLFAVLLASFALPCGKSPRGWRTGRFVLCAATIGALGVYAAAIGGLALLFICSLLAINALALLITRRGPHERHRWLTALNKDCTPTGIRLRVLSGVVDTGKRPPLS